MVAIHVVQRLLALILQNIVTSRSKQQTFLERTSSSSSNHTMHSLLPTRPAVMASHVQMQRNCDAAQLP
jgi:hypothetical protein